MDKITSVPVAEIAPFRDRERDPEKFKLLTESIGQHGLIEPLIVAPSTNGAKKKYQLVAGHGRLRAVKKLGWQKVSVVLRDKFELKDFLVENWRRELSPYEQAVLVELEVGMGFTKEQIGARYNVSLPTVESYVTIIRNLNPELKEYVRKKKITMAVAHRIAKTLPEQKAQNTLLESIRHAERAAPSKQAVKTAVEDVLGAVKVRGSTATLESMEKLEEVRTEIRADMEGTRDTLAIVRSHWLRSVGEILLLAKDANYRKLFNKHGIDYKVCLE